MIEFKFAFGGELLQLLVVIYLGAFVTRIKGAKAGGGGSQVEAS
jgi:hypothetical protein